MATESVTTDPTQYRAEPVLGNFTDCAEVHLWCARALSQLVSNPETMKCWNDDIQDALRYLLAGEISRAERAWHAEAAGVCI